MASLVYLIRHGEVHNPDHIVYADLPGYGLSELGFRQAAQAGAHLADTALDAVYASPLQRAQETAAAVVARQAALAITTEPELTEADLGPEWKGLAWEDLPEIRPGELEQYLRDPLNLPFAGESLEELALRMSTAVTRLAANHNGPIAVVSHQDPIQACRLSLLHRSLGTQHEDKPGHCEVFGLVPGEPWTEVTRWAPPEQADFPPKA